MEKGTVKNKIIALSGEPVSGKGTTVNELIKRLKDSGYSTEQIHIESTGDMFRTYFNSIVDLLKNLDNEEKLLNISQRQELKNIFDNQEYRNIFTKTITKLKKEGIDLSDFSIEQANNREDFKEIRKIVDTLIDEGIKKLGKEINRDSHPNEIWLIDSRLAFFNIPEAFSVRLTANSDVAGERLFNDRTRGKEDNHYKNIEDAKKEREERRIGENKRYLERYGVDLTDENNYDLIIDTSYASVPDIAEVILQCQNYYDKGKKFNKKWASPQIFLPLQTERDTIGGINSLDGVVESIKRKGYLPDQSIEVVNVDGLNYIIEGHHRNFAATYAGKTLIPYNIIAKDDEIIYPYSNTARDRASGITRAYLSGHEWMIAENNKDFSYKKMFPELVSKLEEREGIEH